MVGPNVITRSGGRGRVLIHKTRSWVDMLFISLLRPELRSKSMRCTSCVVVNAIPNRHLARMISTGRYNSLKMQIRETARSPNKN